jgi:chromosome partitioning protein
VIVVSAAVKGGVGKTTTSVYLAAVAAGAVAGAPAGDASSDRRSVTLVDADAQASAAEWIEEATDDQLQRVKVVEAPTERLLERALGKIGPNDIAIVDTPPSHERLLDTALGRASTVVVPTRVGGVETPRATAVLDMVPDGVPMGLVICSARTYTRDYHEAVATWDDEDVPVWGTVPERVAIAAGPDGWLASDGLDAYGEIWRMVRRATRS